LLRREAEQACDDLVIQTTGRGEDYACGLTHVAELAHYKKHFMKGSLLMNAFFATESDLALRIRRTLSGSARRMSMRSRLVAAVLMCGMAAITLPSSGAAQTHDDVDWETVKITPPEEWSQELKDQIAAAGHDVEAIAERVRLGRTAAREERIWKVAMATDPDEWSDRLKAGILELKLENTIEEIAEGIRQRQQYARDKGDAGSADLEAIGRGIRTAIANGELTPEEGRARYEAARRGLGEKSGGGEKSDGRLRDFQRGVLERAMAIAPEEWNDELKAAIQRAGWDLEKFTEGIRQRQASRTESTDLLQFANPNTAVEKGSWATIKREVVESEK
jgi:hypothetical protein